MKKLLAIVLTLVLMATIVGCGQTTNTVVEEPEKEVENIQEEAKIDDALIDENKEESAEETKPATKPQDTKQEEKPAAKPEEEKTQESKPEVKPEAKPEVKPEEKPAEPATLGKTLLADFKAKATAGMSAQEIAEGLMTNPAILFMGGAMPVEEGLLSGFDNAEIKGFKEGSMFAPMIGSIPFVGYVFELKEGTDASAFVANLEKNANLRWNICVTADEMVTGVSGNKVFFVMCPTSLEE